MNENDNSVTDSLTERRRKYLLTMAGRCGRTLTSGIFTFGALAASATAILVLIINVLGIGRQFSGVCAECAVWLTDPYAGYLIVPFIVVTGAIAAAGLMRTHSQIADIEDLPYVPPIYEQIAVLPPAEILLRGAQRPDALPDELHRATANRRETDPVELLRPQEPAEEAATCERTSVPDRTGADDQTITSRFTTGHNHTDCSAT